jgi:hypothetical protein
MPHFLNKQVIWVSEEQIRIIFKEEGLLDQIISGKLAEYIKRSSHPNPPPQGEPLCTFSQIVYYYTSEGEPTAIVHRYLRPNGEIGASGLPDPKRVFIRGKPPYEHRPHK